MLPDWEILPDWEMLPDWKILPDWKMLRIGKFCALENVAHWKIGHWLGAAVPLIDVYKRQAQSIHTKKVKSMQNAISELNPYMSWLFTVSYTHLDVYKRQQNI